MKLSLNFFTLALIACLAFSCNSAPAGEAVDAKEAEAAPTEEATKSAQAYAVNTESSIINWVGSKPTGDQHSGTISLNGGAIQVEGNAIVAGAFEIDMNSINNTDQEAGKGKEKLEGHLKSDDFFSVEQYPTGNFEITAVTAVSDNPEVSHNITGNLTLRGITKSITIPAAVSIADGRIAAKTIDFTIDRTEWDVKFNSGIIGTAKDKLINDKVGLQIDLMAAIAEEIN